MDKVMYQEITKRYINSTIRVLVKEGDEIEEYEGVLTEANDNFLALKDNNQEIEFFSPDQIHRMTVVEEAE